MQPSPGRGYGLTTPRAFDDAIMPLFCPTCQSEFVKSVKHVGGAWTWLLCMGLFSRFLLDTPRNLGAAPIARGPAKGGSGGPRRIPHTRLSSSAKAGDPVRRGLWGDVWRLWNT